MDRNEIFNYKDLVAYQRAKELVKEVYALQRKFPNYEICAMGDQVRRAVVSVTSNIAEGNSRGTYPDKIHFMEMAYASMMEVHSQMDCACDLGYITKEELAHLEDSIVGVVKPLSGLRNMYKAKLHNP